LYSTAARNFILTRRSKFLTIIGPGMLVAATGVGAGDLATGALAGSKLGTAVLWAVIVGAGLKLLLNEGLARWQLATGTTLIQGCVAHFGRPVQWIFLAYLVVWSYFVAAALMSACGICAHAIFPLYDAPTDKVIYGLLHSALGVALVVCGGYRLFAKVMGVCIAVMFLVVVATAIAVGPAWSDVALSLIVPRIPRAGGEGIQWTIALMGGIGGTVTVLAYGYWIREEGRNGPGDLRICRLDLAAGYAMTALFGLAMVIIGNRIGPLEEGGATLVVELADELQATLFPAAKWAFLVGAWGAVFSSLLGVWQSVPYLFADLWQLMRPPREPSAVQSVDTKSKLYRLLLVALATIPAVGLLTRFEQAQKVYAIVGALFIPLLAVALLLLNGRRGLIGPQFRNAWPVNLLLLAAVAFFLYAGWLEVTM
jgi:Mn2+/Fe2+ NRAMP family transporter